MASLLEDEIPRDVTPVFEKFNGEKYAFTLSVKDGKVGLPIAYSDGQFVYDLLSRLTSKVCYTNDFSQLPIPFFCTGTDVSTGESIILDKGNLALAMRASGSFPGLLAPVEINYRLLADGGIVNNFPAKEVKERGMDLVIGVNVEEGLYGRLELTSLEKLITQIGSFQMNEKSEEQLPFCDVLICPDVVGVGLTDFELADTLMLRGERSARELWEVLTAIAERQKKAPAPPSNVLHPSIVNPWKFDTVSVMKKQKINAQNILRNFPNDLQGLCEEKDFYTGITNLYGSGTYQFIDYQFFKTPDGKYGLQLNPSLRPGYDRRFRAALHYDDEYKSSVLLNATAENLLVQNSVTSLDLILGDKFRYNFYFYLDRGAKPDYGVNSRLNFNNVRFRLPSPLQLPDSSTISNLVFNFLDFSNEAYTHVVAGSNHAFGFGAEVKYYKFSTDQVKGNIGNTPFYDEKGLYLTASTFFRKDTRDRRYFPRNGTTTSLIGRVIFPAAVFSGDNNSTGNLGYNLDMSFFAAQPLSQRWVLGTTAAAGGLVGEKAAPYRYYVGGNNLNIINNFKPFLGLSLGELAATRFAYGSAYFQRRFFKNQYFSLIGNVALLKNAFESGSRFIYGAGVSYGIDTVLGPIELTYGNSNEGGSLYFNLGYWF